MSGCTKGSCSILSTVLTCRTPSPAFLVETSGELATLRGACPSTQAPACCRSLILWTTARSPATFRCLGNLGEIGRGNDHVNGSNSKTGVRWLVPFW